LLDANRNRGPACSRSCAYLRRNGGAIGRFFFGRERTLLHLNANRLNASKPLAPIRKAVQAAIPPSHYAFELSFVCKEVKRFPTPEGSGDGRLVFGLCSKHRIALEVESSASANLLITVASSDLWTASANIP
jgi:hypothetical protein